MTATVNVAEVFRDSVRRVDARLDPDTRNRWGGNPVTPYVADIREVAELLRARDVAGWIKYPAVVMPRDFLEIINPDGTTTAAGVTVLVVAASSDTFTSEEREAKVFVPVLYPLVRALLEDWRQEGMLAPGTAVRKVDRQHLAAAMNEQVLGASRASLFNDMLDGVELRGLDLRFDCDLARRLKEEALKKIKHQPTKQKYHE